MTPTWGERIEEARSRGISEQAIQDAEASRQRLLGLHEAPERVATADAAVRAGAETLGDRAC